VHFTYFLNTDGGRAPPYPRQQVLLQSPKKTRFLEFVCEQTFAGNGEKLNEYLIGVEVYDRGVEFNPQKDPIVRVQAHEIRRLLKKYYEDEGKASPIRMHLPSGHYVPIFARNLEEAAPENGSEEDTDVTEKPALSRLPWRRAFLFAGLCLVLAALLVSDWITRRTVQTCAPASALPDTFQ